MFKIGDKVVLDSRKITEWADNFVPGQGLTKSGYFHFFPFDIVNEIGKPAKIININPISTLGINTYNIEMLDKDEFENKYIKTLTIYENWLDKVY